MENLYISGPRVPEKYETFYKLYKKCNEKYLYWKDIVNNFEHAGITDTDGYQNAKNEQYRWGYDSDTYYEKFLDVMGKPEDNLCIHINDDDTIVYIDCPSEFWKHEFTEAPELVDEEIK